MGRTHRPVPQPARESAVLLAASTANPVQERIVRRCIGFAYALAARLREGRPCRRPALGAVGRGRNPGRLPQRAGRAAAGHQPRPAACLRRGELTDILYQALTQRAAACAAIQAACERIKFTPSPFAYSLLLHRTAWLFCLLLPFGLVGALEYLTPVAVTIIAYTFFGLDALGDELEDPSARTRTTCPCLRWRASSRSTCWKVRVRPLPEPAVPVDYVLR